MRRELGISIHPRKSFSSLSFIMPKDGNGRSLRCRDDEHISPPLSRSEPRGSERCLSTVTTPTPAIHTQDFAARLQPDITDGDACDHTHYLLEFIDCRPYVAESAMRRWT